MAFFLFRFRLSWTSIFSTGDIAFVLCHRHRYNRNKTAIAIKRPDPVYMIILRRQKTQYYAAIDLGSNSFHLIVAQDEHGHLKIIDRLREAVRLGQALTEDGYFTQQGIETALACLQRFGERVRGVSSKSIRVVGTNALRVATNAQELLDQGEINLGKRIEIISGVEEARLTYQGVVSSLHNDDARFLIDIGGSSTELVIGEGKNPKLLTSVNMGCVTWTEKYFKHEKITAKHFKTASFAALMKLESETKRYKKHKPDVTIGSSGTIKAISRLISESGWNEGVMNIDSLYSLRDKIIEDGTSKKLTSKLVSDDRLQVLPGGLSILITLFETFSIKQMKLAEGALREGILFDLWGRTHEADVRENTVQALQKRYSIDIEQSKNVAKTVLELLNSLQGDWEFSEEWIDYLRWASEIHEIGISISYNQYHKHGAYILSNADMAGFSQLEQNLLAILVKNHRKKPDGPQFKQFRDEYRHDIAHLCVILRLAVILNRGRYFSTKPPLYLSTNKKHVTIHVSDNWLDEHPLILADLEQEIKYLKQLDIVLTIER